MPDILSQSQIDELLKGLTTGEIDIEEMDEKSLEKKVKDYDFRSPKKFTKEQIKKLDSIYNNFARGLSSYLTGILRMFCQLDVQQIEEVRYHEFNNALPDAVLMGVFDLTINDEEIPDTTLVIEISRPTVFAIIDRLLGGNGDAVNIERDFTEIELSLVENVLRNMIKIFNEVWKNNFEMTAQLSSIETNARLMQMLAPDEIVVITVIDIAMKGYTGNMTICMPAINLEEVVKRISARSVRNDARKLDEIRDNERREMIFNSVKDSGLELTTLLAETELNLSDILNLQIGDIIPLDKPIDSTVDVMVGKKTWFKGTMGNFKGKKAVQISEIL